ncbi:hypothetical protein [Kitasatospora sp. NBC_00458]|uniref:hypothetical protein n=1 Tax=Kitasatospora sp. NBC_00458 TaxID=2903568 RepID=UPI002E1858DA
MTLRFRRTLAQLLVVALLLQLVLFGFLAGAPGALVGVVLGYLLGRLLPDLWALLFAAPSGVRITSVRYGRGRVLFSGTVRGVPVQLAWLPTPEFLVTWVLVPARALRSRLWLSSVGLWVVQPALGVWLVSASPGLVRGIGAALLVQAVGWMVASPATPVASFWAVVLLPFRPSAVTGPLWHPDLLRAELLLCRGRVREARQALDVLPADAGASLTALGVLLAEGRYAEAEEEAREVLRTGDACCHGVAYSGLARAAVAAGDAGELSREQVRARVDFALEALQAGSERALLRIVPQVADAALLSHRPEVAARYARRWAEAGPSPFWRADSYCSLASALGELGRRDQARAALAKARRLYPELARIRHVERNLEAAQERSRSEPALR